MAASHNPDQNPNAHRDSKSNQRAVLDFCDKAVQGLAADSPSNPDRLVAETRRFVCGQPPTAAEPIGHLIQDRGDDVANLIADR
jgi:hypothetical protein